MGSVDQPVFALGASLSVRWAQLAHRLRVREDLRALCQDDRRGIKLRQPGQWGNVGAQLWIDGESATPNASSTAWEIAFLASACHQCFENYADSRDCVEETPKQIRQGQARSDKHKHLEIANQVQILFLTC